MEMSFIFDQDQEVNSYQGNLQEVSESALNSCVSRICFIRQTKSSQINFCRTDQPPVRKAKLCTEEIKTALTKVLVRAQILLKKARIAAQAFSKKFYCFNSYILYKEKYPEQAPELLKTVEDYADYADIFPKKKQLQKQP